MKEIPRTLQSDLHMCHFNYFPKYTFQLSLTVAHTSDNSMTCLSGRCKERKVCGIQAFVLARTLCPWNCLALLWASYSDRPPGVGDVGIFLEQSVA